MTLFAAARVIARRDYTATVLSRTFLMFLLGPLLPILFGVGFGAIASHSSTGEDRALVGGLAETGLLAGDRRILANLDGIGCREGGWAETQEQGRESGEEAAEHGGKIDGRSQDERGDAFNPQLAC